MSKKVLPHVVPVIAAALLLSPFVYAAFTHTGVFSASGNIGAGTDAPAQPFHVYRNTTGSVRFRFENAEGPVDFSGNDGNLNILTGNVNRMTIWKPGNYNGRVTFGQFAGPSGVDVEVFGNFYSTKNIRAQNDISAAVVEIRGEGNDLVEGFAVHAPEGFDVKPGMVVAIDEQHLGEMKIATEANDRSVAGVISGAGDLHAGIRLGDIKEGHQEVALTGRVWCYVDAAYGAITPGDSLTTSATPGHAMKVSDHVAAQGAIIGKAMSSLEAGEKGLVLVLVNLH